MIKSFYGLTHNPFDKHHTSEKNFFQSRDFQEMTARLDYIKNTRGIGVFTAPPGFGKTFTLRCFAKNLNPNLFRVAYICLTTVSVVDFYRQFCAELHIEISSKKSDMFRSIQEHLYTQFKEKRRPLLLVVDEAHELDPRILKDIKMIMNHHFDSLNCFTLLLVGEPHLNHILQKSIHEALRQRINIHYAFEGLSQQETADYILHKISGAGGAVSMIADTIPNAVYGASQGNPRLVDNVMSDALTIGAQLEKSVIDTDTILAAVNNLALI